MSEARTDDIDERLARLEQHEQQLTQALALLAQREAPAAKRGKTWDAYAAVIASLIGLLALAVSGYTAYVQRQQLRAQIWPHLEVGFSGVNLTHFVTNQGTGPARITAVRVTMNGAPVKDWDEVRRKAGFADSESLHRSGISARVLSAGTNYIIVKPADDEASRTKFKELLPGHQHAVSIAICYCSVLDECWTTGIDVLAERDSTPRDCPITASERFQE